MTLYGNFTFLLSGACFYLDPTAGNDIRQDHVQHSPYEQNNQQYKEEMVILLGYPLNSHILVSCIV